MALIKCPECGKSISNQAESCPNCGMPMKPKSEYVLIRFPICERQLMNNECYVYEKGSKKILATGRQGETVSFLCNRPVSIYVVVKGFFGKPETVAYPGDRFDVGTRGLGKIYLSKVDAISGRPCVFR